MSGLGSAVISEHAVLPMELGHLLYQKRHTFEDYVGYRGLKRLGQKKWRRAVADVVARLKDPLVVDHVVVGAATREKLRRLPEGARLGHNAYAFVGGESLGRMVARRHRTGTAVPITETASDEEDVVTKPRRN
ncbi:MAG: hypothetical protein Q8N04_07950 [Nitrospira sp.]|nr:hypothetical protein [Nitrospira sp.]